MKQIALEIGPLLLAFCLCVGLIALLIRPARAWGWVDIPTTRKHHRTPVPLVGGVAMCVAYGLSVLALPAKPDAYPVLLTGMVLLTLVGLYDDLRTLRPAARFLFEIGAVLLMALKGEVVLESLGNLFGMGYLFQPVGLFGTGAVELGKGALLLTVFGVIGVINAFNMSDGLDGLAGGMALIAAGWLVVLNLIAPVPHLDDSGALLALATVVAGFLCFNLRHPWRARASVFMGDAGSTMLGFVLAWFLVHLSQGREAVMTPMTAVWIIALPLMDTVAVMIRRVRAGCSPFAADRQHLHHLLLGEGLSDGRVTALLLVFAFATGAAGAFAVWLGVPEYPQFYGFLAVFWLYFRVTSRIWARQQTRMIYVGPERRRVPSPTDPLKAGLVSRHD